VPPTDSLHEVRNQIVLTLEKAGIRVDLHHHEVASGGQCEIGIALDTLVKMADKMQMHKYIVKNVARQFGLAATFMPKPIFGDNGSGMHTHQSLWKGGNTLMYDENGYAGLSDLARYYIGGILKHAPALLAFTNPSTNSYHRLVPGYEAPIYLVYSQRNRSAAIRIPLVSKSPKAKRIEFRTPDVTSNIYLALAAQMMAGLDGIKNKLHPGKAMDKDLYDLPPKELKRIPTVCGSLREALMSLDKDRAFLKAGGVFDDDQIDSFIELKMAEVLRFDMTPHPVEFDMYYSV
jgi:glutamine synthetase